MWNGAFKPFNMKKHRDYCGDITNHIIIESYNPISEELQDPDSDSVIYEVAVEFVNGDRVYLYELEGPPNASESDIMLSLQEYISPEPEGG